MNKWHGVTYTWVVKPNGKRKKIAIIYKTPVYRQFMRSLAVMFKKQLEPVKGKVHIDIVMLVAKAMDTDGPFKPIFDALQEAGIIENDNLNHSGTYSRYDKDGDEDMIVVTVRSLSDVRENKALDPAD